VAVISCGIQEEKPVKTKPEIKDVVVRDRF
jgi:hypothetical protein